MMKNVLKNAIKNVEDIMLSMDLFLVNILEGEDNLVIDNQNEEDVIVFKSNINWNWSNDDGLGLHIWDGENKVSMSVNNVEEDEDSFDRLYVGNLLLTVM
ncbi:hypothetical protein GCM10008908_09420 [Clostridium subterminale]|uniref:Uncharacterized protein n=1 Tax=Clostridium subterminale TaxID=1550 RepID=A0ABN1KJJ4_CLOSU